MKDYYKKEHSIVFFILSLVAILFLVNLVRIDSFVKINKEETYDVLLDKVRYIGYEKSGEQYQAYGIDPQMYIPVIETKINGVVICFEKPVTDLRSCYLYYAGEGEGLSEERCISYTSLKESEGIEEIFIEIPEQQYSVLRLDLEGVFSLESIEFSIEEPEWITEYQISIPTFISFIFVLLCGLFLYFQKKKNNLLKKNFSRQHIIQYIWLTYILYVSCIAKEMTLVLYLIPIFLIGLYIIYNEFVLHDEQGMVFVFWEGLITIFMYIKLNKLPLEVIGQNKVKFVTYNHSMSGIVQVFFLILCALLIAYIYIPIISEKIDPIFNKDYKCNLVDSMRKDKTNAILFAFIAFIIGMILIYIVPPTTVPDEDFHYTSIFRISRGNFFVDVVDRKIGSYYTEEEMEFISRSVQSFVQGSEVYSYEKLMEEATVQQGEEIFLECTRTASNPIPYIIASTGVAFIRILVGELSPYNIILIAKIFNLLFYVCVTYIALRKTAILKNVMFLLALMPMTIYQCSSASYDAILIPSMFLLFAYVTKILFSKEDYIISFEDIFAVLFSLFFIFGTKIAYVPLVITFFAIPINKFGGIKRYLRCIVLVGIIGLIAYIIPNEIHNSIVTEYIEQGTEQILSNIDLIPKIIVDTFNAQKMNYLKGFVGYFGWFDTQIPIGFIIVYVIILVIVSVMDMSTVDKLNVKFNFLSYLGVAICLIGTMLAMYIEHNVIIGIFGGTIAYGFQGRYLIPIVLFGVVVFSNTILSRFKYKVKILNLIKNVVPMVAIAYVFLMLKVLYGRYWM